MYGHESSKVTQSEVIAIGLFKKILQRIKPRYAQPTNANGCKPDLLKTWESQYAAMDVISGRIKHRCLQGTSAVVSFLVSLHYVF